MIVRWQFWKFIRIFFVFGFSLVIVRMLNNITINKNLKNCLQKFNIKLITSTWFLEKKFVLFIMRNIFLRTTQSFITYVVFISDDFEITWVPKYICSLRIFEYREQTKKYRSRNRIFENNWKKYIYKEKIYNSITNDYYSVHIYRIIPLVDTYIEYFRMLHYGW